LVRDGFAALCESSGRYHVVGECGDGAAALDLIRSLAPDFAVLGLNLSQLFTLEVVRKMRTGGFPTKAVVVGTRRDRKTVVEVLRSGASAYVLESGPGRHLLEAFDQIRSGAVYVSPLLDLDQIFIAHKRSTPENPLESLSSREYQVFTLLIDGVRAKEIAARLELSPKTVDTYRASLMRKLEIYDLPGLVKFAIHNNLIPAAPP
jgi:DNA-binding NarL/FixJ family response regulator